jgi:hypothetical protein
VAFTRFRFRSAILNRTGVVLTDCFGVCFDCGTYGMNFSHQFGAFALEFLQHFGKFLQAA